MECNIVIAQFYVCWLYDSSVKPAPDPVRKKLRMFCIEFSQLINTSPLIYHDLSYQLFLSVEWASCNSDADLTACKFVVSLIELIRFLHQTEI